MSDRIEPDELRPEDDRAEDARMAELLARLDDDAPSVDERQLAELRGRSLAAFAHSGATVELRRDKASNTKRRPMILALTRLALAATAAAIAVAAWFAGGPADEQKPTFGTVLTRMAHADSVELALSRDGKEERVLVKTRADGPQFRWNRADGTYTIAAGNEQWDINEQANQARVTPAMYFTRTSELPGREVDVLKMLDVPAGIDRDKLAGATPVEQVKRGDESFDVYRWNVPMEGGALPVRIEAFVNEGTRMLSSMICATVDGQVLRPRSKVDVVAVNKPIDDAMFVVGSTLTDDGRIGKVADVQGIVTLKPAMHERWTPVVTHALLRLGDWVRTDVRGANAVQLRLVKNSLVTLGPGTLVELQKPNRLRISSGEVKIVAEAGAPVELLGVGDDKVSVTESAIYRLQNEKLVRLEKAPQWLAGFEGTTNNESLGSLVAKVDGRDVPLTVGYHKVSVDIRDQIARTVVEESFVNHTGGRLEGVFYFPLPQDASISGFGMWIGSELVEADIVEKQRAREIYETILREKRDPGLLEWTGGNIFKARVFPIEAHSEKRIKISYTQVLPLSGSAYRYSYGLRSELLKQNPLRELAIDVKLNSAQALAGVHSPTHTTARVDNTAHSAHVEFSAEEYTPERDFELVVELAGNQPNVVMIPHRRGDDGYFMLMMTPPDGAGQWQRDVLPDGKPLNLVILADTSASMDAASRAMQAQFVAALLSSLGPKDKFNLGTCDVETAWTFPEPMAADETHVESARKALADRVSLGWTDLDKAFESALKQSQSIEAGSSVQIVYVGDGIITTKDADPAAFAKRLALLCQGKPATLHAVSVSSSFEPMAMKAIASAGGGSLRQVTGEMTPQQVALELLSEISRPTLRNLKIAFNGIETARVYPSELPNLAAGSQQIALGRYLPKGQGDHTGEVVVTGLLGDEPVRFRTAVTLPVVAEASDAKEDVSFIPRLWARMHLDALLVQGKSQTVQDEIIGLSEEYHIITPYTSLLVLESDADRERFGVKRRFQMRDAERFFAEGRDNANFELLAQQMKRAGTWRLGLRQRVLAQLVGLGRNAQALSVSLPRQEQGQQAGATWQTMGGSGAVGGRGGGGGGFSSNGRLDGGDVSRFLSWSSVEELEKASVDEWAAPMGGAMPVATSAPMGARYAEEFKQKSLGEVDFDYVDGLISDKLVDGNGNLDLLGGDSYFGDLNRKREIAFDAEGWDQPVMAGYELRRVGAGGRRGGIANQPISLSSEIANGSFANGPFAASGFVSRSNDIDGYYSDRDMAGAELRFAGNKPMNRISGDFSARRPYGRNPYTAWLDVVFPPLAAPPAEEQPLDTKKPWPAEVKALVDGLLRAETLAALVGGLKIERRSETFEPRWNELASRSDMLEMVSPSSWLTRGGSLGSQTLANWCDKEERGIYGEAFWTGRRRKSSPRDLAKPPLGLPGHLLTSLERSYVGYDVKLEAGDGTRSVPATLVLTQENNPGYEVRITIDTAKKVILSIENRQDGELTSRVLYDEFVEVGGAWYAGRTQAFDKENRRTSLTTEKFTLLAAEAFTQQMSEQLASRAKAQFLKLPLPSVVEAKRHLEAGQATFEDQIVLLLLDGTLQQWDSAFEHVAAAERLAGDKQGMRWVRDAILNDSRRREELRRRVMEFAGALVKGSTPSPQGGGEQSSNLGASEALFLANICVQDSGTFEANELLALLDLLKPVYERQPAYTNAMKGWLQNRANQLRKVSRAREALAIDKEIAEKWPHDYSAQQQYALHLADAGDWDAAYAWLDGVITPAAKWHSYEEEQLRSSYIDLLNRQGRRDAMADYLKRWVEQNPDSQTVYERYLAALLRVDRIDEANALIGKWLADGRREGKLPTDVSSRLSAAIHRALGRGYDLYTNRLDEQWLDPLAETVRYFFRSEKYAQFADEIMNDGNFQRSDQYTKLRRAFLPILQEELATLKQPVLDRLVNWSSASDPAQETDAWRQIATRLAVRWQETADVEAKHALGETLMRIYGRLPIDEQLAFHRRRLADGPEKYRAYYANQLFHALIAQPWTEAYEDEAFGLLELISNAKTPPAKLVDYVRALYELTDRMVKGRYDAAMAKLEHQEELTRTELRDKQADTMKAAREGFATRLDKARAGRGDGLAKWMLMERLYLDVQLGRNLDGVANECWELLGPVPTAAPTATADAPQDVDAVVTAYLDALLRNRSLLTLANLAARKNAQPELVSRLMEYVDKALAARPDDAGWRSFKYQMLVALDRPRELEAALREWLSGDDPLNVWRIALGNVLAEQGKITDAVAQFETVERDKELGPAEYRTLADWYLVLGQREKQEAALVSVMSYSEEWRLSNWLYQQLNPWRYNYNNQPMPRELDPNVVRAFTVLFEKSGSPQNYAGQLAEFYRATHDFRLIAGLGNSVVGHTAGRVYPFLQGLDQVFANVREEATVDSLHAEIEKVRVRVMARGGAATSPARPQGGEGSIPSVDLRALDLLDAIIERRAAEVLNQPGPHGAKAVAALERAFDREWTAGEERMMADLLSAMGNIHQADLAAEQTRELVVLHGRFAAGTLDRLHIAHALAQCHWNYSRQNEAIDLLEVSLGEYRTANGGVLPSEANGPLDTFVRYLEETTHHARGEEVLLAELRNNKLEQQKYWLRERLYRLYRSAIDRDGAVTLGSGDAMYQAVNQQLQKELDTPDQNHRSTLVSILCEIFRAANGKKFSTVHKDLLQFATGRFQEVLRVQTNNYQGMVRSVADTAHDVNSPRDGIEVLVTCMEHEPAWFRFSYEDSWNQFSYLLAQWRHDADTNQPPNIDPALAERLLPLVLTELRRDLESRQQRNRQIYGQQNIYFWQAKRADFLRTAEAVYEARKTSSESVQYIADYLYGGLNETGRAISMLLVAHGQKLLDENGQATLARYLQEQNRFGESIAILQPLVELRPDNLDYRTRLMHAYFKTSRREELLALLKASDTYFHEKNRWGEGPMAALAYSCLQNELYKQSVAYYEELIPLHQRTQPNRGIGNGTLSNYYGWLAQGYAGLKNTAKAVDAASGAIVSWGSNLGNRQQAIRALEDVLRNAPDLDAFVVTLDGQVAESGLENPIVRQAVGKVYSERGKYPLAIKQLELARQTQPNDADTHKLLVECYDKQNDKAGAVKQLLASVELSRRDLNLYRDLGRRYQELEQPAMAERANTSIVEMQATESESHTMLAEIRQQQNRWGEAIDEWRRVSEIRKLEPTGLVKLVEAQIHEKQWDAAEATLRQLDGRDWPPRFNNVTNEIRNLRQQISRDRPK